MIFLHQLFRLSSIIDRANSIVEDLNEVKRYNQQYNYDKIRIDRLKKEIDSRANIIGEKSEKSKNNNRKWWSNG